jgi:protein-S-isoprenylcysteine O-methyltransferase
LFYLINTAIYLGVCYLAWRPLPLQLSPPVETAFLFLGALLYFPGMGMVVWGRLALAENYFVSSGFGAQLFAGHRLVTSGPFAMVRHPMYLGLILAALGSLLIYLTWTTLFFTCFAPLTLVRARREEEALSAEFGEQWQAYCRHVPAFFPRLRKRDLS